MRTVEEAARRRSERARERTTEGAKASDQRKEARLRDCAVPLRPSIEFDPIVDQEWLKLPIFHISLRNSQPIDALIVEAAAVWWTTIGRTMKTA
ncbi:unnamed protein product [Soboliphyme baturini]|uniref:Transposase n=1 Tax=Soboliphyme baturini TaxID=241478 RepID=A0A183IGX1_9BILA|nr:unnamed protein product [Soboliphyme baturini]